MKRQTVQEEEELSKTPGKRATNTHGEHIPPKGLIRQKRV